MPYLPPVGVERVLQAKPHRTVVRVGDTVRRPTYPWSPFVHRLLQHLESVGFAYSPRFLGIDEKGREVLSFIEGICGADGYVEGVERGADAWAMVVPEVGLARFATLLREYHDAVATFDGFDGYGFDGFEAGAPGDVVCHNDFGPWNVVWRGPVGDGCPVGIIDWDYAAFAPRLDDVAFALEWSVPFCPDEDCLRWRRFDAPPDRRGRIAVFADAYGVSSAETDGLVDAVVRRQHKFAARVRDLAARGIQPAVDEVASGYLDEVARRIAWSEAHRHELS